MMTTETGTTTVVGPRDRSPFRFTVATLLGLVAVVAVASRWPLVLVPALPAAWDWFGRKTGVLPRAPVWPVLGSVYLPCLIGLLNNCDHCRGVWEMIWPAVPGVVGMEAARAMLGISRSNEVVWFALSGVLTLAWIALLLLLASRGRRAFLATITGSAVVSTLAAAALYQAIRS